MGCCQSKSTKDTSSEGNLSITSQSGIQFVDKPVNTSSAARPVAGNGNKPQRNGNEDDILNRFKAKRANVFSEGIDDNERSTYRPKRIVKTAKQAQTISK